MGFLKEMWRAHVRRNEMDKRHEETLRNRGDQIRALVLDAEHISRANRYGIPESEYRALVEETLAMSRVRRRKMLSAYKGNITGRQEIQRYIWLAVEQATLSGDIFS